MRQCLHCGASLELKRARAKFCSRLCVIASKNAELRSDYFSVPNLHNSYWAGFIAADGNVYKRKAGNRQAIIKIALKSEDDKHLEKFAQAIAHNKKIYHGSIKTLGREYSYSSIAVSSNIMAKDLESNFNITERKSLTLKPPTHLSEENAIAFIAGYIDGDGSYTHSYGRPILSVVGTKEMLEWILPLLARDKAKISCEGNYFSFALYGDSAISARGKYINMPLPFLDRKYRRWENLNLDMEIKK